MYSNKSKHAAGGHKSSQSADHHTGHHDFSSLRFHEQLYNRNLFKIHMFSSNKMFVNYHLLCERHLGPGGDDTSFTKNKPSAFLGYHK